MSSPFGRPRKPQDGTCGICGLPVRRYHGNSPDSRVDYVHVDRLGKVLSRALGRKVDPKHEAEL